MATIRKRRLASGKSVWQCDYRDQHGRRRSKQFDRKRDADAFLVKARGEVTQGLHVADSETGTVRRAYERPIEVLKAESAAPATIDNYEVYYRNHVRPFLGTRLLTCIDAVHVQDLLA
jgi:integrase